VPALGIAKRQQNNALKNHIKQFKDHAQDTKDPSTKLLTAEGEQGFIVRLA
jgi:hypothetical protein